MEVMHKKVKILVGEPWDTGVINSCIIEEKNGILLFYTEQPITVGEVQTRQFYGKPRHVENTGHYNFCCIPGVEGYSIDDIKEYEKDWSNVKFFMIGSIGKEDN